MRIRFLLPIAALLLASCGGGGGGLTAPATSTTPAAPATPVQAANPATAWVLEWSDEFDGSALDHAKWVEETGGNGFGNHELQYYTARPENVRVAGGQLVIEARREDYGGNAYTSARVKTAGKIERTYGRFEARMKIPRGQGIWPAFWLLGADIATSGWPACGEIDIMENVGKEPATVYGTLHGPGYSGANGFGGHRTLASGALADDFHVYAVEWEPGEIRWYLDGVQYHSAKPSQLPGPWVYDHPFYIIINLAVGGDWPGSPDASTVLPQQLVVDWVRVWRRAN